MNLPREHLPRVRTNPRWLGTACLLCGREYGPGDRVFVCDDCGVDGILDVHLDLEAVRRDLPGGDPFPSHPAGGMWRFAPLLPVAPEAAHHCWTLGGTPAVETGRLAAFLGLGSLVIKDDTGLPSASLKDRAAALAIAHAVGLGIDHLACASTGNAAASLAVLAARAGLSATIFVPRTAPRAKLAQLLLHGARVIPVAGTYDQAFDLSIREIDRNRWYSRNCAHNPLLVEGKKTAALELAATLTDGFQGGDDRLPDAVFVPVGDGCIVSSVGKAFGELKALGLIGRMPRIYGVQAAGAAPLADGWQKAGAKAAGLGSRQVQATVHRLVPRTVADSISVGIPRNRLKAWQNVARSGGGFLAVPDEAILEAIALLAEKAGIFAEPSGAAGMAGVVAARQRGLISATDKVAVMVTGHGLKDPEAALGRVRIPDPVPPAE